MLTARWFLLPVSVLAAPDPRSVELATGAAASPRPAICRPAPGGDGSSLWARARTERTFKFCQTLSRGYARLESDPKDALALAREATKLLPAEVEARVLEGRALLRLGDVETSRSVLASSVLTPGRPLGDLASLRELAVASTLTGRSSEAASVYRVLLPRIDVIRDALTARIVLLEGAAALMASDASAAPEALLYLAEARQSKSVPGYQDLTLALFALALDREGKSEEARAALEELSGAWSLRGFLSDRERVRDGATRAAGRPRKRFIEGGPVFGDGELHAAIALAALRTDGRLAADHANAFVQSPAGKGPWGAWARARFATVLQGGKP